MIRILLTDPVFHGLTGTVVRKGEYGGSVWVRVDPWPAGVVDVMGDGTMWLEAGEFVEVESVVERAA